MAKTITRKSPQEKQAEIDNLREWYDEWASEQDEATLALFIALHDGYSEGNALLIASQLPDATDVRGYRTWLKEGRQVRKGETGARIWQPKGQSDDEKDDSGETTKKGRRFFGLVSVFDITQTDPKDDTVKPAKRQTWDEAVAEEIAVGEDM